MISSLYKSFWKTLILFIGIIIIILGLIMLFTPGQGILTIILGFSVLATEFVWAKQLNQKLKKYLTKKGHNLKSYIDKKNK